jgi:hypothetical protein
MRFVKAFWPHHHWSIDRRTGLSSGGRSRDTDHVVLGQLLVSRQDNGNVGGLVCRQRSRNVHGFVGRCRISDHSRSDPLGRLRSRSRRYSGVRQRHGDRNHRRWGHSQPGSFAGRTGIRVQRHQVRVRSGRGDPRIARRHHRRRHGDARRLVAHRTASYRRGGSPKGCRLGASRPTLWRARPRRQQPAAS